jgi:hypothetical protein
VSALCSKSSILSSLASLISPARVRDSGGRAYGSQVRFHPEGYDKLVVSDIIALLNEALKGIGVADNSLLGAHVKAKSHNPTGPGDV